MENNFSTSQVKNNGINALSMAKDVVLQIQQGQAVITAVKCALQKAPGCPEPLKLLLVTPYGDAIVGLLLHTAAPIFTSNKVILNAVKAANVAGAVELSRSFTFVQDALEQAILALPGISTLGTPDTESNHNEEEITTDESD